MKIVNVYVKYCKKVEVHTYSTSTVLPKGNFMINSYFTVL